MALVAYTDPQGVFGQQEPLILKNLGVLKNLHWRPLNSYEFEPLANQTIRTIPQLDLQLAPENGDKLHSHQILGLNHAPLVQIFVVETCSLEIYREKLRQIGKNWLANHVNRRDCTGYVVVHAVNAQSSAKLAKSINNRLINEFGSANCVQLDLSTESGRPNPLNTVHSHEQLAGWSALRHLVAEQLLTAFGQRIDDLHREIRKLQANQSLPGYNFGQLFAVHISLASAYASLGLLDDALRVHERLAPLFANQRPETDVHMPKLALDRDSLGLGHRVPVSQGLKMRDAVINQVLSQQTSQFDIQQYLLAKQVDLRLGMAESQAVSSSSLADQLVREAIRLAIAQLPRLQNLLINSWGVSRGLNWLLTMLQRLEMRVSVFKSERLAAALADLVLVQRDWWQQLGSEKGYAIPGVFNDVSLVSRHPESAKGEPELTKLTKLTEMTEMTELTELTSPEQFEAKFTDLSNQATELYKLAGMSRAVLRLMAQQLLVHYYQQRWEECYEVYEQYPMLLQSPGASALALYAAVLACARHTKRHSDVQKLAWRILHRLDAPLPLVESAVHEIESLEGHNEWEAKWPIATWFATKLSPFLRGNENGYFLELELHPRRPAFPFVKLGKVRLPVKFVDQITKTSVLVWFESNCASDSVKTASESVGSAGSLRYQLYTHQYVQGVGEVGELEVQHSASVKFYHKFEQTWIKMLPLSTSFTASVALARDHSMRKRDVVLTLNSPRVVKQAKVRLLPVDQHLQLQTDKIRGADAASLANFTTHSVAVPALIDFESPVSQIKISIEYDMGANEGFSYEFIEKLDFSLAVSVDFQESFRKPPKILTQFLVKPFNSVPIWFLHSNLQSSAMYSANRLTNRHYEREMMAFSHAPISYVFAVAKQPEPVQSAPPLMQFELQYRSLLTECQHIWFQQCLPHMGTELRPYQLVLQSIIDQLSKNLDYAEYVCTNRILLLSPDAIRATVDTVMELMDPKDAEKLSQVLELATEPAVPVPAKELALLNSKMQLDVPNPDAEVVHYISLQIVGESLVEKGPNLRYTVGEPITVKLEINTITFRPKSELASQTFVYELDRLSEGWSYTGRVQGTFIGGNQVEEQLTLIPNRSGELFLPNVIIKRARSFDCENLAGIAQLSISESSEPNSDVENEFMAEQVIVSEHANTRLLVVPETNMLAITF